MTILAVVALLAIPVAILAKSNPATVVLTIVFGLFLGMTAPGSALAGALNQLGAAALTAMGGVGA
jgi:uncharacterized integral membrane protein